MVVDFPINSPEMVVMGKTKEGKGTPFKVFPTHLLKVSTKIRSLTPGFKEEGQAHKLLLLARNVRRLTWEDNCLVLICVLDVVSLITMLRIVAAVLVLDLKVKQLMVDKHNKRVVNTLTYSMPSCKARRQGDSRCCHSYVAGY